MAIIGLLLIIVGGLTMLVGNIMVLIKAFQTSILWGLGSFFVPFVILVFVIMHWEDSKKGFLIALAVQSFNGFHEAAFALAGCLGQALRCGRARRGRPPGGSSASSGFVTQAREHGGVPLVRTRRASPGFASKLLRAIRTPTDLRSFRQAPRSRDSTRRRLRNVRSGTFVCPSQGPAPTIPMDGHSVLSGSKGLPQPSTSSP